MVGGVVYLDASAIVKLVVDEPESASMLAYVTDHPHQVTSVIADVEVPRAILRRGWQLGDRERAVLSRVVTVAMHPGITSSAAALRPSILRSLDAIHLATALSLGAELDAFVTYDLRLVAMARALGLRVVAPA